MLFEIILQAHNSATEFLLLWNGELERGYYVSGGPGEAPDVCYIDDWNYMNYVHLILNQLDSTDMDCNVDFCDSYLYDDAYDNEPFTADQLALLKKGTM